MTKRGEFTRKDFEPPWGVQVSVRARNVLKAIVEKAAEARGVHPSTFLGMQSNAGYKTVAELLTWLGLPDPDGAWAARWEGQVRRARRAKRRASR